jgi:hypothetical protein
MKKKIFSEAKIIEILKAGEAQLALRSTTGNFIAKKLYICEKILYHGALISFLQDV